MAYWNKSLLVELQGYSYEGLLAAKEHYKWLKNEAIAAGEHTISDDIKTHLACITKELKSPKFSLTKSSK